MANSLSGSKRSTASQDHPVSIADRYKVNFVPGLYLDLIVALLIVIAAHAFTFYKDFRAGEVRAVRAESATRLSSTPDAQDAASSAFPFQYTSLDLFTRIGSLPRANSMITRLGDFLRLTLEHSEEQTVTLKQEIEFL